MQRLTITFFSLIHLFCATFLVAQNSLFLNEYTELTEEFGDDQIQNNKVVDNLINEALKSNSFDEASKICFDYSLFSYYKMSYEDAIHYVKWSVSIKEDSKTYDNAYKDALFRAAYFSYVLSDYEKSTLYYKRVIELNIDSTKIGQSYCGIGNNYFMLGDYDKAINYYNLGIKKLEYINAYKILSKQYVDLSNIYFEIGTDSCLNEQLNLLKKAESLEKHIKIDLLNKLRINNGLATVYGENLNFDFKKARYYSNQNLRLSIENKQYDYTCTSYNNLSNIYNLKKKDSALYFAQKALEFCTLPKSVSLAHFQEGDYYKNIYQYERSLENIQKGINHLIEKSILFEDEIYLNYLTKSNYKYQLLFLLIEKNKLLKLQTAKQYDKKYTTLGLQHVLVADSLIDVIQSEASMNSKVHWRLKASELYSQGIQLCYELNKPETAFYLSEKGKSLLLTEAILNNNALTKLPDSIRKKQDKLKKASYSTDLKKEDKFTAQLKYEAYIDSIKLYYPNFFKNQDLQKVKSLDEIKNTIDENSIVVSYLWPTLSDIEDNLYGLFITKESESLINLGNSESIKSQLIKYLDYISRPLSSKKDRTEFNKVAFQLYSVLLNPNNIKFKNKNIVILPDGPLHNIPFEVLNTSNDSLSYLIEHNIISYAYSMSFLGHNNSIKRIPQRQLTAFAPITFDSLSLPKLKNSFEEIKKINSIINGEIFVNSSATKSSFIKQANNYKIIHLATHADAKSNPWIAFNDQKMSLQDLYTFNNSADLAVLSSCNSSIGELATGEGVMSLARGFFYSGSKSVVASLWTVNDKSTSFLMEDFYKNLKNGQSKSAALRNAKLNYLKSHSLSEASPYYWSSFILLGDTGKIDLQSGFSALNYLIIGFLVFITLLFYIKLKKK